MEKTQEERLYICTHCAIYNKERELCSASLYIDPKTNAAYSEQKPNTYKGCGCYIPSKIKNEYNHCPARKW